MGIDNAILFLPPLIVALAIGIMIGWEIAIAAGSLAGLIVLFVEASRPNASPLYLVAGIVITVVFFIFSGDSLRRIIIKDNFKSRVTDYIAEGQRIFANSNHNISTEDYIDLVRNWSEKVSKDIRQHKGQAEMEAFLAQASTQEYEHQIDDSATRENDRRNSAAKIVSTRKYQLELLRERL